MGAGGIKGGDKAKKPSKALDKIKAKQFLSDMGKKHQQTVGHVGGVASKPVTKKKPAPTPTDVAMKCGGKVKTKKYAKGGGVESRGKTKGRFC